MPKLAINGGKKVRTHKFPAYITVGEEEEGAALRVIKSGSLSRFLGCWHEDFYGGAEVRAFEEEWSKFYGVKHAIAVNSATAGIFCAVGATGVGPGDEVIVTPYSMSVSASAPLIYNAIPVFADIEEDYFCLSPESTEERITERTKAIIVVDIMGQPYDADKINAIAKRHNLFVIEDCAQAPCATFKGEYAGTLGDIGIFSLNYHKHIHTGEGGVVVTNNDDLAEKVRLIRNHAEAVIDGKGFSTLVNMVGFNYRMTEIEAAIGREQLKKLPDLLEKRLANIEYLTQELVKIPCLEPAKVRPGSKHAFYVHPIKYDRRIAGIHRDRFVEAVKAELMPIELREIEGVKVGSGYVKPLYLQPIYQNKIAYGSDGCPWSCAKYQGYVSYDKGICPVAEHMYDDILITHELMRPPMARDDLDDVVNAFSKVWKYRDELR
ncbi:MAG TPA: DegT/DnrJ/EryC1/StrS family aminotransferase [Candidatus Aquicultor sp.]|jgi:dTDP-4-amino-4,6-dideoxygalactose transaminase